jgi:hypothetical protein
MRRRWRCPLLGELTPAYRPDGTEDSGCLGVHQNAEMDRAMQAWSWMRLGFLPRAGGLDDQANLDIEMLELLESERRRWEQKTS